MLNPWSGSGEHVDWKAAGPKHHEKMRSQVSRVIDSEQWFCLWIPLRSQAHASSFDFINRDFLVDECLDVMHTLFPPGTNWELSKILPMLRIRNVQLWDLRLSEKPLTAIASTA